MTFIELLLYAIVLYWLISVALWLLLDCNILLWYKDRFGGVPISTMRGQIVWITGASSGIGRALALELASNGVKLALSARRVEQLKAVQAECLKRANGLLADKDVLVLPMDMLDTQLHENCLQSVLKHFGHIDVLVNNAGRSQRAAWEEIDVQVDRDLFELDVFAVMNLSRLVVKYYLKQAGGRGQLAVTSSIAGLGPVPYSATYCAAKSALNAYISCLRMEQPTIDVTIYAPGPVATDFLQEAFTAQPGEKVNKSTANQKRLTAERCGHLFAVAIANKLELTWCGLFPVTFLAYCMRTELLGKIVRKIIGRTALNKIREGKL